MNHTVLICDDTIFMRSLIGQVLGAAGFEVVGEAETGMEAVERYKNVKPDLVTMDVVMPDMGGIEAVRAIKEEDPSARILMCSAIGQRALLDDAINAGAREYIVKPFTPSDLLNAIERTLA